MVVAKEQEFDALERLLNETKLRLVEMAGAESNSDDPRNLELNPADFAHAVVSIARELTNITSTRIAIIRGMKECCTETFALFLENRAERMEEEERDVALADHIRRRRIRFVKSSRSVSNTTSDGETK